MLEKTRGVVLRTLRYKEDSLIVDIYTELHGTVSFLVRVPKSKRAALHTQLLTPLSILDIDFDHRPSQALQRLKEVHLAIPYSTLTTDPIKLTLSLFLSEFLYHALRHEAANPQLMEFLCMSLRWLDLADEGIANFHIVFMTQLTRHLGFWPDAAPTMGTVYFDLAEGTLRPGLPQCGYYLAPEEAVLVPLFMRLKFGTMHLLRLTRDQRARALAILIMYYRLHVPEFPDLKSVSILAEILR